MHAPLSILSIALAVTALAAPRKATFTENKGQWPAQVLYRAQIPGGVMFVERSAFTYVLVSESPLAHHGHAHQPEHAGEGKAHAYRVNFEGGNAQTSVGSYQQAHYENYFIWNDPAKWGGGCRVFGEVLLKDVWPGVDVRINGKDGVKYDLVVAADADPSLIRLRYEGQDGLTLRAIENKSGYGQTVESELKMLRVIKRLKQHSLATIKPTFLGAHAIPWDYKNNREAYIDLIIQEMLPQVAAEGLADYCDVFCDQGFFTVAETDRILKAALQHGLKAKIHANELAISGGVQVGIANNAVSVDHLEAIGQEEIDALKVSDTIPTVLPSCSFFLNIHYAPARKMKDQGLGIAIATDYNPGSSPSGNIPLLMAFARNQMRLLPTEAFNGVTINGAHAMELGETHGTIGTGKIANLIITKDIPSLDYMVYAFGSQHIDQVILKGVVV